MEKIKQKKIKIGVLGMGYVGLPLCVKFANSGFEVLGFDIDSQKINMLNKGESYISDVEGKEIQELITTGRFSATNDFSYLKEMDVISICVPTPLRKTREPDISYIIQAVKEISKYIKKKQLIILESTTYPGTTEEVVLPILETDGKKVEKDFYLAFSPERVDPGNKKFTIENTPKIVSGITEQCLKHIIVYYEQIVQKVIPVSSTKVAEMVKLLENTFRIVNIGLVNELAVMCDHMKIDVWEIIEAAATKPFGFMPFYPGPGIGGHCIGIDPYYLVWKAKVHDFNVSFIELAGEINRRMPDYILKKIIDGLNKNKKCLKDAKILLLGISYKENVGDIRESPALDIAEELLKREAKIFYNDPYLPELKENEIKLVSSVLTPEFLQEMDCVVIMTNHKDYDYDLIVANAKLIVDTRNATKKVKVFQEKIIKI